MLQAVRASPGAKAATLSRESQALTHAVRAQLDGHCFQGDAEVGPFPFVSTALGHLHRSLIIDCLSLPLASHTCRSLL